jgi:isoleucyl-tRNA synthetase
VSETQPYPKIDATPSFPDIEREILDFWAADGTFRTSVEQRPAGDGDVAGAGQLSGDRVGAAGSTSNEFVFYDGPPFANGLPHYGHLLTGYVKDLVPRYQTMRGRRVERRFGWDCHGLPAEVEAEKQLGITTKAEILELGVDKFNAATRESVFRYTKEWERYVNRQARWVDFDNDYKTLDLPYMESVMWAFKSLYDKGLIYEGFRVLAYCWRCETPLSNTETRMDDVYADRQDPAVTVAFTLDSGEKLLVWTTTPWTLPSNLAIAVGPDIDYAVLERDGERYIIAEARLSAYDKELAGAVRVGTRKGAELVGRRYRPLFDFLVDRVAGRAPESPPGPDARLGDPASSAFTVLSGDFVTTEDGTGVVHLAPAYGEDDQNTCEAAGIPTVLTVDDHTRFTALVPDYQGLQVFEANKPIVRDLRERGVLLRLDSYLHPYPHCWRCETPLVYKAVSSWFVKVSAIRDRMVELNQQIDWTPAHVRDGQFGKWLAGARDWSISRSRFWGSPVPVWRSDDPAYPRIDVYGSLDEIERDFSVSLDDLHRPGIDALTRPNPDDPTGRSTMRRVHDVLDCWFESGSMPFAQVHYPFENTEWFEQHYPGDFIVEYTAQTRGWFYTLHVLATALFDRPAFRSCVVHGTLLGADGRKMSKSLRNYPDVYEMFDAYGSDAIRWAFMSSPVLRGGDMSVSETVIRDAVRQALNPLWNVWYFFTLYANAEGYRARPRTDSSHVLDRYALAKLRELVATTTEALDRYEISAACAAVRSYVDALTNWYVRRSRSRFWQGDRDAFDTLYTVLETLCRVMAPLAPMITEAVYRGLTGQRSVHLTDWPDGTDLPADPTLVSTMDKVREVCSAALSVRKATGLRVRLPLRTLTVAAPGAGRLEPFTELIADEVNVKQVVLTEDLSGYCDRVLSLVPRALGPRLGPDVQRVIRAVKAGDWSVEDGVVTAGGVALRDGEYELRLLATDAEHSAPLPGGEGVVVLDAVVTPELYAEGLARDVVRVVQMARRDAGLDVADRIGLAIEAPAEVSAAVDHFRDFITRETLATSLSLAAPGSLDAAFSGLVGDGHRVLVALSKLP